MLTNTGKDSASLLGPVVDLPQANVRRDEAYTNITFHRIADAGIMAYRNMTEARLYFGKNIVEGLCYNRAHLLENGRYITYGCGRKDIVRDLNGVDSDLSIIMVEPPLSSGTAGRQRDGHRPVMIH